jgi:hypothetical protein
LTGPLGVFWRYISQPHTEHRKHLIPAVMRYFNAACRIQYRCATSQHRVDNSDAFGTVTCQRIQRRNDQHSTRASHHLYQVVWRLIV